MQDAGKKARDEARLNQAYDELQELAPDSVARAIRWLRDPKARPVRVVLGLVLIVLSFLGPVLPVVGIEMLPLGLLLLAQDIPPLRGPVASMTLWLERKWVQLRRRRAQRRHAHHH